MYLYALPKEIHALIASYLPDRSGKLMRILANDMIVKTISNDCTYANGLLHSFNDEPIIITVNNIKIIRHVLDVYIGDSVWFSHGMIHRTSDLPAVLLHDHASYYINDKLHRDNDLPAIITSRYSIWYCNGVKHRDNDLPALVNRTLNYSEWYWHGEMHRDNDRPAYVDIHGTSIWYCNGDKHRDNLPAVIINNGYSAYYKHGNIHRIDGPAVIHPNGTVKYYIDGILCDKLIKKHNYSFSTVASLVLGITIGILIKRYFN